MSREIKVIQELLDIHNGLYIESSEKQLKYRIKNKTSIIIRENTKTNFLNCLVDIVNIVQSTLISSVIVSSDADGLYYEIF